MARLRFWMKRGRPRAGAHFYARESLPATLAPFDPDAALAIARGGDEKAPDDAILQIVQVLARADADRAREWVPQVLAEIGYPGTKLSADIAMARALVESHPDEAKAYFAKVAALPPEAATKQPGVVSKMAALSAQLKLPDAPKWFESTLGSGQRGSGQRIQLLHLFRMARGCGECGLGRVRSSKPPSKPRPISRMMGKARKVRLRQRFAAWPIGICPLRGSCSISMARSKVAIIPITNSTAPAPPSLSKPCARIRMWTKL